MKKIIISAFVLLLLQAKSFGQFSFGVSSGITFNSAYFGYKIGNKVLTYIGFQYANVGMTNESSGTRYNYSYSYSYTSTLVNYDDKTVTNISLYLPNIGARYYISEKNKVKSYATLNVSKPFIGGNETTNDKKNDSFKDDIKNIKLIGGECGYGAEYAFDENFSIGGEFGIRYIHLKTVSNSNSSSNSLTQSTSTSKIHVSPTYAKFVLNYYF